MLKTNPLAELYFESAMPILHQQVTKGQVTLLGQKEKRGTRPRFSIRKLGYRL
jgi:hypothetical protein